MDNSIIVIATTEILNEKCKKIIAEEGLDYPVYDCFNKEALALAKDAVKSGTKVIISRGGTAAILRENLNIPVVDVRHTYEDFYLSAKKAFEYSDKVAFVGYDSFYEECLNFKMMSGINLEAVKIHEQDDVEELILSLMKNGIDVVVGGYCITAAAKKCGIRYVKSEANESFIRHSLKEAQYYLQLEVQKLEEYETINSIISNISEGIIGIDENKNISYINHVAKKIIGFDAEGKNINEVFDDLEINDVIIKGNVSIGKLINAGETSLVANSIPINIKNKIIGAVITIQKSEQIQSIDLKIRKKHLSKGHFAKKTFEDIIGSSNVMQSVKQKAKKFAKTDNTILILGETGVGKEVFAQSIHNHSMRKNEPFVAINCAALPQNILESELFGYVKGAFTGAKTEGKEGIFELAHHGTVFLDEISETPLEVQAKLLRVIQEREVTRIGDDKIIPIDVRIIAATNRDLIQSIEKREFREDLYYRLCVLELNVPPLRERKGDILDLINYFLNYDSKNNFRKIRSITYEAKELLLSFEWLGNVRELNNIVKRLEVMSDNGIIDFDLVREATVKMRENTVQKEVSPDKTERLSIFDVETELIMEALRETKGNKAKAAEKIGISKTTLWRKMKKIKEANKTFNY
jgi:sigma-54 dependent transcriptional regulator, acetoin dehydrogenase operon transcriptional activator AcoR